MLTTALTWRNIDLFSVELSERSGSGAGQNAQCCPVQAQTDADDQHTELLILELLSSFDPTLASSSCCEQAQVKTGRSAPFATRSSPP
jgi:hypothetical protein